MAEIKLTKGNESRFELIVEGFIKQGVLDNKKAALERLDELAKSDMGKKFVEFYGDINNEGCQGMLIDALKDEIGRNLTNPKLEIKVNVANLRVYHEDVLDDDNKPTGNKRKVAKLVGSIIHKEQKTGHWSEPKVGEITGYMKEADKLEDKIKENKAFLMEATTRNLDQRYVFWSFDERCKKIEKIDEEMPKFLEIVEKVYDITDVHDAATEKSERNNAFDYRLVKGRVVSHPTFQRRGRNQARFELSDSSVTPEDIGEKGSAAYLAIMCDPSWVTFGKDSVVEILGTINHDDDNDFGPVMWSPRALVPIISFALPETQKPQKTDSPKEDAGSVIQRIMDKKEKEEEPKEEPEPEPKSDEAEIFDEPEQPKKKGKTKVPEPEQSTEIKQAIEDDIDQKFKEACQDYGTYDSGNDGCQRCFKEWEDEGKDTNHIFPACRLKSGV